MSVTLNTQLEELMFSSQIILLGGAFAIRASSMAFDLLKFSRPRSHDERRQRGRRVDRLGRGHGHSGTLPKTPLLPIAGCSKLATRLASNQDCPNLLQLQR